MYGRGEEHLVKIFGDVDKTPEFITWLVELSQLAGRIVVCLNGDSGQNKYHTAQEYWSFREGLERDKKNLAKLLKQAGAKGVLVVIPMFNIGNFFRHVSDELYLLLAYQSFEKVHVVTLEKDMEAKMIQFVDFLEKTDFAGF